MFSELLMDLWNLNLCTICIMLNVRLKLLKIWFSVWLRELKIWITVWLILLMMIDSTVAWMITYLDMILEDARNFVWNKHSMIKYLFSIIYEFPSVFYRLRYIFVWKYLLQIQTQWHLHNLEWCQITSTMLNMLNVFVPLNIYCCDAKCFSILLEVCTDFCV